MTISQVAKNIRGLIDQRGYKQYAVARMAKIDHKKFNDMLNGRRVIKAEDIIPIASALGVTPNDLLKTEKTA